MLNRNIVYIFEVCENKNKLSVVSVFMVIWFFVGISIILLNGDKNVLNFFFKIIYRKWFFYCDWNMVFS